MLTPMLFLLMGSMEISYFAYVKSVVSGAMRDVARSTSTGQFTQSQLDGMVRTKLATVGIPASDITITTKAYQTFDSTVSKPEPLTSDSAPLGQPNVGDCFYDLNKNGVWNSNTSGGPEDILYYGVTAKYKLLFRFTEKVMNGANGYVTIKTASTVKNEPYNNNAPEVCITSADQISS